MQNVNGIDVQKSFCSHFASNTRFINPTKGGLEMKNLHHLMHFALFFLVLILVTGCNQTEAPTAADAGQPSLQKSSDDDGRINFHFLAVSHAGANHNIIMFGNGNFTDSKVRGGGVFQHTSADPSEPVPKPILGEGTWKAKRLVSWVQRGTYGVGVSGVLTMEIKLRPNNGPAIPATLQVTCNIPPAGLFTGNPEGYILEVQNGLTFVPFGPPPSGITWFTNPRKSDDDND